MRPASVAEVCAPARRGMAQPDSNRTMANRTIRNTTSDQEYALPGHPDKLSPPMAAPRLTPLQWLICAIAALGFAFDIYEILMAPLVVGPAIGELTGLKPGTPDFNFWVGMFFWVPALVGGAFGLVGGYLTDRFGRRRVLVYSILLYAFSAFAEIGRAHV